MFLLGCQTTLDVSSLKLDRDAKTESMIATDDIRGPLERVLQAGGVTRARETSALAPAEGLAELKQTQALYDQGDYKRAGKAYKRIAKAYKETPVGEEALFLLAESQFAQKRYAAAQDSYDELIQQYPSTRYLDRISQRKFDIARAWLGFPAAVNSSDIQPVNFDNPAATPPPADYQRRSFDLSRIVPIFPNLWDRSRPVFDTDGRALEALKSIWLNDPTGPLADDSLMLTASHAMRHGNYVEADRLFETLRQEYPKSPHLENAFVLGSHVKLVNYQGAKYDGTNLDEALKLNESTLKLFPNHPEKERILDQLREIKEAQAERVWQDVLYYQKRKMPRAVAVYCREVLRQHPNSSVAARARQTLSELNPEDGGQVVPEQPLFEPSLPQPYVPEEEPSRRANVEGPAGRTRL